ncbi:MAG: FAD:protein FMN transferase [bacterium]
MTRTLHAARVITALLILLLTSGCAPRPRTWGRSMMGTEVAITIHDGPGRWSGKRWKAAADSAFTEMHRVEVMAWSGELASLNDSSAAGSPDSVSDELYGLIDHAFEISEISDEAFTPAIGPLVKAWGIAFGQPRIPRPGEIDTLSQIVHHTVMTRTNHGEVWLKPRGAAIELGGIAKGYAVDRAVEVLQEQGMKAGMVWAGGDLRVFGRKPDGKPWRIAVRHPRNPSEFLTVLELKKPMSVATSGDYERYFEVDGVRYHHIIDPATGYPARASISTTAVGGTCMDADAFATALFVMGPEWGILMADRIGMPAMVVSMSDTGLVVNEDPQFRKLVSSD